MYLYSPAYYRRPCRRLSKGTSASSRRCFPKDSSPWHSSSAWVSRICFIFAAVSGQRLTASRAGKALHDFWFADWGFDWYYDKLFVQPVLWFARVDKKDGVDAVYNGVADLIELLYSGLSLTENGRVRWYAAAIAAGTVVFVTIALFL